MVDYPAGAGMGSSLGTSIPFFLADRAPVAIGLTLTLLHITSIPIDNTSLNPARSTATVLFAAESWPLAQLWLFWVAPIIGGVLGGLVHKSLGDQA